MSDSISRQAAIEAITAQRGVVDKSVAKRVLAQLPSAQPEIILCKDCKWGREVCGNIECFVDDDILTEYHGYEWFCPKGERRTDG